MKGGSVVEPHHVLLAAFAVVDVHPWRVKVERPDELGSWILTVPDRSGFPLQEAGGALPMEAADVFIALRKPAQMDFGEMHLGQTKVEFPLGTVAVALDGIPGGVHGKRL